MFVLGINEVQKHQNIVSGGLLSYAHHGWPLNWILAYYVLVYFVPVFLVTLL